MAEIETRRCLGCEQVLPLTDFRKNGNMRGGYTNRCKPCLLAMDRARWAAMDPDKLAATKARYRQRLARYREANPERIKKWKAEHYQQNRELWKERGAEWRKNNPERVRALSRGWNHLRYKYVKGGVSAAVLATWVAAQPKVCHWCGQRCAKRYEIDHILALSQGGQHQLHNLCIACRPCNRRKSDRDPIEWAQSIGKLL